MSYGQTAHVKLERMTRVGTLSLTIPVPITADEAANGRTYEATVRQIVDFGDSLLPGPDGGIQVRPQRGVEASQTAAEAGELSTPPKGRATRKRASATSSEGNARGRSTTRSSGGTTASQSGSDAPARPAPGGRSRGASSTAAAPSTTGGDGEGASTTTTRRNTTAARPGAGRAAAKPSGTGVRRPGAGRTQSEPPVAPKKVQTWFQKYVDTIVEINSHIDYRTYTDEDFDTEMQEELQKRTNMTLADIAKLTETRFVTFTRQADSDISKEVV